MNNVETPLSVASQYLAAGIIPVVITHPSDSHPAAGKGPRLKGWQQLEPSQPMLNAWFSRPSNLGVICGKRSGLVCIDIDPRNGGMKWLIENDLKFGFHLRENTGSGGYHLYYRYPEGIDHIPSLVGQNGLAPGVELKADGGHQVVTWPSVHPSGGDYEFHHGLSLLDLETEANELPRWILDIALERSSVTKALQKPIELPESAIDCPQELERAIDALKRHGPAIQGQGGDVHTYRAACLGVNYGISANAWWPHLLEWNKDCQPLWNREALAKKLTGAYQYAKDSFGKFTAANDFPEEVEEVKSLTPQQSARQEEELGLVAYNLSRPAACATKFASTVEGYFNCEIGHFYYYNDTWNLVPEADIRSELRRSMDAANPEDNIKLKHVNEAMAALKDRYRRVRFMPEFDSWEDGRPGNFVRVANGILDLDKAKLLPHSPNWLSCTKLPYDYDEHARCPTFEAFLRSIWPTDDMQDQIEALQRWIGYMLTNRTDQQKILLLLGPPGAGKGTLLDIMSHIVGVQNVQGTTINKLGRPFGLGPALGKKAMFVSDAHSGNRESMSTASEYFKNISGEDLVPIERKGENEITVKLPLKIVLAANDMPAFVDIQGAFMRRLILIQFTKKFTEDGDSTHKTDPEMRDKLRKELPGILNWAMLGLEKMRSAGGLLFPESSREKTNEIVEGMNPVLGFIEQFIEYDPPSSSFGYSPMLHSNELYGVYCKVCELSGQHPVKINSLVSRVSDYFADRTKYPHVRKDRETGGLKRRGFYGLKLVAKLDEITATADWDDDLDV